MSEKQTKQDQKATSASTEDVKAQVQEAFDEANERGYFGAVTDPTPNENYTVAGVTAGKPTPETDAKLAAEARTARNQ